MATSLVLPKLPIMAQITLFGGTVVSGEFFVAAATGLIDSVRRQLVQLYRIMPLTNVERGVDLLCHCL